MFMINISEVELTFSYKLQYYESSRTLFTQNLLEPIPWHILIQNAAWQSKRSA